MGRISMAVTAASLVLALAGCRAQAAEAPAQASAPGMADLQQKTGRFAVTDLSADLSALPANEPEALPPMVAAAQGEGYEGVGGSYNPPHPYHGYRFKILTRQGKQLGTVDGRAHVGHRLANQQRLLLPVTTHEGFWRHATQQGRDLCDVYGRARCVDRCRRSRFG